MSKTKIYDLRPTLDEWVEKHSAAKVLKENLETNLRALTDLNDKQIEALMRMNMIMVRQFGQDCGLE